MRNEPMTSITVRLPKALLKAFDKLARGSKSNHIACRFNRSDAIRTALLLFLEKGGRP